MQVNGKQKNNHSPKEKSQDIIEDKQRPKPAVQQRIIWLNGLGAQPGCYFQATHLFQTEPEAEKAEILQHTMRLLSSWMGR